MGSIGNTVSRPNYYEGAEANIFDAQYKDAGEYLGPRRKVDVQDRMDTLLGVGGPDFDESYDINPNYNDSSAKYADYHENCALCTFNAALYLMGYEVEAMPRDEKTWRGSSSIFNTNSTWQDNIYGTHNFIGRLHNGKLLITEGTRAFNVEPDKMPRGATKAADAIYNKVKSWGEGSFGEIHVSWSGRDSSHSMLIMNHRGNPTIYDAQDGQAYSGKAQIEKLLKRTNAVGTTINRLDTAKPLGYLKPEKWKERLSKMIKRKESR